MKPGEWPHQFTKSYNGYYICVHCHIEFKEGEKLPTNFCPARNDKREIKRIKS